MIDISEVFLRCTYFSIDAKEIYQVGNARKYIRTIEVQSVEIRNDHRAEHSAYKIQFLVLILMQTTINIKTQYIFDHFYLNSYLVGMKWS